MIAATNRDIEQAAQSGEFREDLFYRLNVFPISLPPLRERPEDIPLLVNHFMKRGSAKLGKKVSGVQKKTMTALQSYHFPGNIRELENIVERAIILAKGTTLELGWAVHPHPSLSEMLKEAALATEGRAIHM